MTTIHPAEPPAKIAVVRAALEDVFSTAALASASPLLPPAQPTLSGHAKIVVAGRLGTGKTELIQAVLGRPDLLPVGPTLIAVHIVAADSDEALRVHLFDGSIVINELDQRWQWLHSNFNGHPTRWGSPRLGDELELAPSVEAVDSLEMLLDEPRLARMSLVDTPGVVEDGTYWPVDTALRAAAAREAALHDATALVLVIIGRCAK